MNYISGQINTYNKDGAVAARFAFFDYLDHKAYGVDAYTTLYPGEYRLEFTNLPIAIWEHFATVWMDKDGIYPYQVGCCALTHKNKKEPKDGEAD